jgi:hypothetical protein
MSRLAVLQLHEQPMDGIYALRSCLALRSSRRWIDLLNIPWHLQLYLLLFLEMFASPDGLRLHHLHLLDQQYIRGSHSD